MATSSDIKRTHIVKVRFNKSELNQFNVLAEGSPLASYARRSLLKQPVTPGRKQSRPKSLAVPSNAVLIRQVASIGNNLNQIARSLNTQLKNHPDQAFSCLVVGHLLQQVWERLGDMQNI